VGDQPGQMTVGQLRVSLHASVIGDRLVRVSATTSGSELSRRLADQTVTAYIDHVAAAGAAEGATTEQSTVALVEAARAERDRANEDVKAFLAAKGFADATVARLDPTVEDSFIARTEHAA